MARYIDADVLKETIEYYHSHTGDQRTNAEHYAFGVALKEIDRTPTADVAEVKHGKWEGLECSICGHFATYANDYNYCPQCGTKMDAERKETT